MVRTASWAFTNKTNTKSVSRYMLQEIAASKPDCISSKHITALIFCRQHASEDGAHDSIHRRLSIEAEARVRRCTLKRAREDADSCFSSHHRSEFIKPQHITEPQNKWEARAFDDDFTRPYHQAHL